jgi:hypothetical protein
VPAAVATPAPVSRPLSGPLSGHWPAADRRLTGRDPHPECRCLGGRSWRLVPPTSKAEASPPDRPHAKGALRRRPAWSARPGVRGLECAARSARPRAGSSAACSSLAAAGVGALAWRRLHALPSPVSDGLVPPASDRRWSPFIFLMSPSPAEPMAHRGECCRPPGHPLRVAPHACHRVSPSQLLVTAQSKVGPPSPPRGSPACRGNTEAGAALRDPSAGPA